MNDAYARPVSIMDYEPELHKRFPALHMRRHTQRNGIDLGFYVSTFISMEYVVNEDQVTQVLDVAVERLQIEGIHALGLQPRLDAYEAELRKLREERADLTRMVQQRNDTIARLEAQIDEEGEDDEQP